MANINEDDLTFQLEQAVQEQDLDAIGLGHNMGGASLEVLHGIVEFAERLKQGALVEMYLREREAKGERGLKLVLPPEGYMGYFPKS